MIVERVRWSERLVFCPPHLEVDQVEALLITDCIVQEALAVQDLRAAIDRDAFRELLGPPPRGAGWDLDRPFRCWKDSSGRYRTEGVSTCGLVAAGIMARAGMRLPWNGCPYWESPGPYRGLDIVSELSLLGQLTGTRCSAPQPGFVACLGSGLGTHVLTIVAVDGDTVTSVDGGQIDDYQHGYLQCTKLCTRLWSQKRVNWIIDTEALWSALEGTGSVVSPWSVEDTQIALIEHGFDPGPVDGIAGRRTRAAVIAFQLSVGLKGDGVVGPLTRAALQKI